ncbi:ABC-2 type transport system permease protein [Thermomonospora echinospora]|uniref:ABC-2 type transport system permease protein n=1 Tax=Thermomonospora echinospora TaxID=1992 RepID=A0A1H5ZC66_9ACTN|nr:ABC transporter permease [Thermomonospora echinospora]SEG33325.1 ABC-2 type transport system permease protein [Thermomonospora echinospora]
MSAGTIHDIGYRHYDGRRLSRPYVLRSLYVHNLRAAWGLGRPARAKVMPFLLVAIMLLPAAGDVAVVAVSKEPSTLWRYSAYPVYLQVVIAIFLATQAPVLASRELRFHVVPLYFSRPVGQLDFVLAKLAAMTSALFLLMATPVTVLYVGGLVNKVPDSVDHALRYLGALVGVGLFAVVLAALGLVVAAFTPRRGFGVAAVIAVFMLSSAFVLIIQGIAEAETNFAFSGWMGLFTPFNLVDAVQVRLLGAEKTAVAVPPAPLGGPVALLVCLAVVLGSTAVLYRRFRKGADL